MRGKLLYDKSFPESLRNIPAYAGKTRVAGGLERDRQEHPRVCGENRRRLTTIAVAQGTSPRMRGKRQGHAGAVECHRNIPAYAGKTLRMRQAAFA